MPHMHQNHCILFVLILPLTFFPNFGPASFSSLNKKLDSNHSSFIEKIPGMIGNEWSLLRNQFFPRTFCHGWSSLCYLCPVFLVSVSRKQTLRLTVFWFDASGALLFHNSCGILPFRLLKGDQLRLQLAVFPLWSVNEQESLPEIQGIWLISYKI